MAAINGAAQFDPPDRKTFFNIKKLPIEIRINIYNNALTADRPLHFSRQKDEKGHNEALHVYEQNLDGRKRKMGVSRPGMPYSLKVNPVKIIGCGRRYIYFNEICAPGLLSVDKATLEESRPILYARNAFSFDDAATLKLFNNMVGVGISMVTDIMVYNISLSDPIDRAVLFPVYSSPKLKRLCIGPARTRHGYISDSAACLVDMVAATLEGPATMHDHKSTCACWSYVDVCTCIGSEQQEQRLKALVLCGDMSVRFSDEPGQFNIGSWPEKSDQILDHAHLDKFKDQVLTQWREDIARLTAGGR